MRSDYVGFFAAQVKWHEQRRELIASISAGYVRTETKFNASLSVGVTQRDVLLERFWQHQMA